jgi:hypothetical protein
MREGMFVFPWPATRLVRGVKAGIDGGDSSGGGAAPFWACKSSPAPAKRQRTINRFTVTPAEWGDLLLVMSLASPANKKNGSPHPRKPLVDLQQIL